MKDEMNAESSVPAASGPEKSSSTNPPPTRTQDSATLSQVNCLFTFGHLLPFPHAVKWL